MNSNSDSKPRYRGFLSYSHADRKFARKLHHYLENFKVPTNLVGTPSSYGLVAEKLGTFFMDREELPSAPDLSNAIGKAIGDSDFLIVLCSPYSALSEYVNQEVLEFKRLGRADHILCIITEDVAATADPVNDCFCPALKFELDEQGELSDRPSEPIAADARANGDGYKSARLKLVAGLLGVGYDGLRQRELQRYNRRLVGIASASLAGMVLTVGLSMVALEARDTAQRHREEADKLIGFMLGDLRSRLDEVGRLDILDSVVDKTISYFQNLPADELNERTRVQRSAALTQLGQVKDVKGEPAAAKELFTSAYEDLADICGVLGESTDQACLYELGQVQFWLGNGYFLSGDSRAALRYLNDYKETSRRLLALDPQSNSYQLELAMSYSNLAVLNSDLGNTQTAFELAARAIATGEQLYAKYPTNQDAALTLANAYGWSGKHLYRDLQFDAALAEYKKYLDVTNKGLEQNPKSAIWLDHQMIANRELGHIYESLGDDERSESHYRRAIDGGRRLIEIEPDNQYWQEDLTIIRLSLIGFYLRSGSPAQADQLQIENSEVIATQMSRNPDDINWAHIQLSNDYLALRLNETNQQLAQNITEINQLLFRGRALQALAPDDRASLFSLVEILISAARLEKKALNDALASKHYEEALKLLEAPNLEGLPMRRLTLVARLHAGMGTNAIHNHALQTLQEAGYKGYKHLE